MEFTDSVFLLFIFAFFLLWGAGRLAGASLELENRLIAGFSLAFYATWYPPALLVLLGQVVLARFAGPLIGRKRHDPSGRRLLAFVVALSLAPLFVFKYYDFFTELIGLSDSSIGLLLPVGISFYTFTAIGYYVDAYRGDIEPEPRFWHLALFLAFWPHLAAGPILRARNIFENIRRRHALTQGRVALAAVLIVSGLFKKLVVADNIGAYINSNLALGPEEIGSVEAFATLIGFGGQVYSDFSGYSDMAIGFALLLGFRLPANFDYPFRATTLGEFWGRWHISLMSWFRDYLYIPLGGNRMSNPRTYANILAVFAVSGLWHGAALHYVLFGVLHGVVVALERFAGGRYLSVPSSIRWLATNCLILIAWSFFIMDAETAVQMLARLFAFDGAPDPLSPYYVAPILMLLGWTAFDHLYRIYRVDAAGYPELRRGWSVPFVAAAMVAMAMLFSGQPLPFIYFEF